MHWMLSTSFRQCSAARNRAGGNAVVHAHHHTRQAEAAARSSSLARERARAVAHQSAKARSIVSSPHRAALPISRRQGAHRSVPMRLGSLGRMASHRHRCGKHQAQKAMHSQLHCATEMRRTREGRSLSGRTSRNHCPLRCWRILPLPKS